MSQPLIGIDPTRVFTAAEVTAGTVPYGYGDTGVDASGNEYMFVKSDATGLTASAACLITASGSGSTLVFTGAMATLTNSAPGEIGPGGPVGVAGQPSGHARDDLPLLRVRGAVDDTVAEPADRRDAHHVGRAAQTRRKEGGQGPCTHNTNSHKNSF
jgi:hypothetical protein